MIRRLIIAIIFILMTCGTYWAQSNIENEENTLEVFDFDAIYKIEEDKTVAEFKLAYRNRTGNLLWFIPIPDDVAPIAIQTSSGQKLPYTYPSIITPPNYCDRLHVDPNYNLGSGWYPPLDAEIEELHVVPSSEILDWMSNSTLEIDANIYTAVENDISKATSFVVLNLAPARNGSHEYEHWFSVRIEYQSQQVLLPWQQLITSVREFEVEIDIFGDSRYVSTNYMDVQPDITQFRMDHAIAEPMKYFLQFGTSSPSPPQSNYLTLMRDTVQAESWQAFYTFVASRVDIVLETFNGDDPNNYVFVVDSQLKFFDRNVREWFADVDYITRLYGVMPANANSLEMPTPEFIADRTAPMVSNIIDATHLDPLTVWGCTTRALPEDEFWELLPHLPEGRTRVGVTLPGSILAHRLDWNMRDCFDCAGSSLSPSDSLDSALRDFRDGNSTHPILYLAPFHNWSDNFEIQPQYSRSALSVSPLNRGQPHEIGIFATDEDFAENEALYRAMVDFPFTYQYALHPALRHTLALKAFVDRYSNHELLVPVPNMMIGYPEGWHEQVIAESEIMILPEHTTDSSMAPYISIYPIDKIDDTVDLNENTITEWVATHFEIDQPEHLERDGCQFEAPMAYFEHNGRRGYIGYIRSETNGIPHFIVEVSALNADYEVYETLLYDIRASFVTSQSCQ